MSRLCEKYLDDHQEAGDTRCPTDPNHTKALQARAAGKAGQWSPIVRGSDAGGPRDFLDGEPIHCGSGLELQEMAEGYDDYGSFSIWRPSGAAVRYEVEWGKQDDGSKRIVLYASVGGHTFTAAHELWMRFRWPSRPRR